MNPPIRMFRNRPAQIPTFQATRKRRSKLETKFNLEYPDLKWDSRTLSLFFKIPLVKVKELIDDKPTLIKYIYTII